MEELRKLEEVHRALTFMQSRRITTTSLSDDSNCFLSKLKLLLVQPCGELDLEIKCSLVSEYMPKITAAILEETCNGLTPKECGPLQTNLEEIAVVGLDTMQQANSTLEDFCRSYFMFHGMDINKPQSVFQCLPMLSFTESYIYQLDNLNEKTVQSSSFESTSESERGTEGEGHGRIFQLSSAFLSNPFRPLECLLQRHGLLPQRMQDKVKSGEEYWALERKLCHTIKNNMQAKYITEAKEKYNQVLKQLDPQLSLHYQKRCVEATKEGGNMLEHPLGTWSIPPLILDEDFYRSSLLAI